MYLAGIKLKNFRSYKDEEFSFDSKEGAIKPLTIIFGVEGAGKSVLFNAVGWALYGEETEILLGKTIQERPIPNVNSFGDNGKSEVYVSLDLKFQKDNDIDYVKISRKAEFYKGVQEPTSTETTVAIYYKSGRLRDINSNSEPYEYEKFMKIHFPKELIEFHMFTGESLERTYETSGANLERGIKGKFKLGAIHSMAKELGSIMGEYTKIYERKINDKELIRRRDSQSELSKQCQTKIESLQESIEALKKEENKEKDIIEQNAEEYGRLLEKIEQVKELDQLKGQMRDKVEQLNKTKIELYKEYISRGIFLSSKPELESILLKISERVGKLKLPPDVEAPFIKSLLNGKVCICGRPIQNGSEEELHLRHILEQKGPSDNLELLTNLNAVLTTSLENFESWGNSINNLNLSIEGLAKDTQNLDRNISNLSTISEKLTENENKIKNTYTSAQNRLEEIKKEIPNLQYKKEGEVSAKKKADEDVRKLDGKIQEEGIKRGETKAAQEYYRLTEIIKAAIEEIPENLFEAYANALQEKMNTILSAIDVVSKFSVKISYYERKLKFNFDEAASDLKLGIYMSGGQNQLIGICLMASFIAILGDIGRAIAEPPMVLMDHPISNLSEHGKEIMAKKLVEIFGGIQIILFATDSEMPSLIQNCGAHDISRIFKLENDKSEEKSTKKEMNANGPI